MAGVCSVNEQNYNDRAARKLLLQSGTCQAGVNSCQVGLLAAPLPRARAAEGGPHTYGQTCDLNFISSLYFGIN